MYIYVCIYNFNLSQIFWNKNNIFEDFNTNFQFLFSIKMTINNMKYDAGAAHCT